MSIKRKEETLIDSLAIVRDHTAMLCHNTLSLIKDIFSSLMGFLTNLFKEFNKKVWQFSN